VNFKSKTFFIFLSFFFSIQITAQDKPLTFKDIMQFRQIKNPVISSEGKWVGYTSKPDRGNSDAVVMSTSNSKIYVIERGEKPVFSDDELWTAVTILPDFAEMEKNEKEKDKPKNDLKILNTSTGDTIVFNRVQNFLFSKNSKWIAVHFYKEEPPDSIQKNPKEKDDDTNIGTKLSLFNLENKNEIELPFVINYGFDSLSNYFSYSISDTSGTLNGFYLRELKSEQYPERIVDTTYKGYYTSPEWNRQGQLTFIKSKLDAKNKPGASDLMLWDKTTTTISSSDKDAGKWIIPSTNKLKWSKDEKRLFFGYKPKDEEQEKDTTEKDIYDYDRILEKRELDVWHWNDPLIKSNDKKRWKDVKDQTYQAVYLLSENKTIPLADYDMPYVSFNDNENYALGYSDVPYLREVTWKGYYYDFYIVDLKTGERKKIIEGLENYTSLSPGGNFVAYYKEDNWHLYNIENGEIKNLTINISTPFYDEDNDVPAEPRPYGVAGWIENDKAVLIYDKYDLWKFNSSTGEAINITDGFGRKNLYTFRIINTETEKEFYKDDESVLLTAYHDKKKQKAFYKTDLNKKGVQKLLEEEMTYSFVTKAEKSNQILFTKESYNVYSDLWISDLNINNPKRLTDFTAQTKDFAWGNAELVEWLSQDGIPLQGVLIKPGNYEEGKKYPVIVYYYEISSDRLYEFNEMVINHRPNFPFYASNGYAIFLPDIKFEIGRPGYSATKCLVPGVQKLIEMGIADPDAIGLHGHSWSGYQTAFVVTQTDIFACAVAGAPVSNMTSAYSGIRWGTGLARQFQYEHQQSRIGGSLWEYPMRYLENSPVFFADKIHTPLLIEHGDEDEAVPWYQSIELYLAMRRLNKDCIFLQYRGEPHHLKKYANKLDYSIKMKEYFDHYLKKEPAADWIINGMKYKE
jgi:dipeptidyl aminopeptidase/acylaminoacyl peptidase